MSQMIKPIFDTTESELLRSTKHRFGTLFSPIQSQKDRYGRIRKYSDFFAYVSTPVIDVFLESAFIIDVVIHLLNACASLLKALYLWPMNQAHTPSLLDRTSAHECSEAFTSVKHAGAMLIAQTLNSIFSLISLISRPIVSALYAAEQIDTDSPSFFRT